MRAWDVAFGSKYGMDENNVGWRIKSKAKEERLKVISQLPLHTGRSDTIRTFQFLLHVLSENEKSALHRVFAAPCAPKAMAPHSNPLAWKIPWMEEPGRLQPMGLLLVRHDWATSLTLFTFMHWRWKWQPIPVFLPRESQGRGSPAGCRLWGCTELDTAEAT